MLARLSLMFHAFFGPQITGLHLSHHVGHVALQQVCHAGVKMKDGTGPCVPGGSSQQRQNVYGCVCVPFVAEAEAPVKSSGLQQNLSSIAGLVFAWLFCGSLKRCELISLLTFSRFHYLQFH